MKWCAGPCGRQLPESDFYRSKVRTLSYCKRCDNVRRVSVFKAKYSTPTGRMKYLMAQRVRRRKAK